jgi:hypothetical protein
VPNKLARAVADRLTTSERATIRPRAAVSRVDQDSKDNTIGRVRHGRGPVMQFCRCAPALSGSRTSPDRPLLCPTSAPIRSADPTSRRASAPAPAFVGRRRPSAGCGRRKPDPRYREPLFWHAARVRGATPPYALESSQNRQLRGVWSRLLLDIDELRTGSIGLFTKGCGPCWRTGRPAASENPVTAARNRALT